MGRRIAIAVALSIVVAGCRSAPRDGPTPAWPVFRAAVPVSADALREIVLVGDGASLGSPRADGAASAWGIAAPSPALDDEPWRFAVTPFLWATDTKGTVGRGALQAEVKAPFGDIVDDITDSAALHLAAVKGDWLLVGEFSFYDLESTEAGPAGFVTLDYDESRTDQEILVGTRVLHHVPPESGSPEQRAGRYQVHVLGGVRYTRLKQRFVFTGPLGGQTRVDEKETWTDPVVAVRCDLGLTDDLLLEGRGDVGGFGVGSDLTWTAQVGLAWWVARSGTLRVGYRHRDIDYEDDGFVYDVKLYGPYLSFTLVF